MDITTKQSYDQKRYEDNKDEMIERTRKYNQEHKAEINERLRAENELSRQSAVNNNKPWTFPDMVIVATLRHEGDSVNEIAIKTGRTVDSIKHLLKTHKYKDLEARNIFIN